MEYDITEFFNEEEPSNFSSSAFELGDNAGIITWNNANDAAEEYAYLLDTEEKKETFKRFVLESGGWSEAEVEAWDDKELVALLLQWISGEMRECDLYAGMDEGAWKEYQQQAEQGLVAGHIYGGPLSVDGRVYFLLN